MLLFSRAFALPGARNGEALHLFAFLCARAVRIRTTTGNAHKLGVRIGLTNLAAGAIGILLALVADLHETTVRDHARECVASICATDFAGMTRPATAILTILAVKFDCGDDHGGISGSFRRAASDSDRAVATVAARLLHAHAVAAD
jgi:hypothetical protein